MIEDSLILPAKGPSRNWRTPACSVIARRRSSWSSQLIALFFHLVHMSQLLRSSDGFWKDMNDTNLSLASLINDQSRGVNSKDLHINLVL